jgi:activator of HSP90 ATPase
LKQYETKKEEEQVIRTSQIDHSYDFKGISARDLYEALLDPRRADIWSHGKSKVSKRIGSEFRLFDGNVHGMLVKAVS